MSLWRHPNRRTSSELPTSLRRTSVPGDVRAWAGRSAGAKVVGVRRMPGASSTAVHELRLDDGRALVLRRYVWTGFLEDEPDAPEREVAALTYAAGRELPVPAIVAADPRGVEVGDSIPAILMTRLRGRAHPDPDPEALAAIAAEIHRPGGGAFDHDYIPWCRDTSTRPPRACRNREQWAAALEIWRSAEPRYEPRFIHRDFHPGNVLWFRGRLGGVVDWANACIGPPGIDVATCRWNLADWAGSAAADAFVSAYEHRSGKPHDPYWDIAKIVEDDWDVIDDPERVAQAETFLAAAMRHWLERNGR